MVSVRRRDFLAQFSCSVGASLLPLSKVSAGDDDHEFGERRDTCWLEVTAPFVIESPELGIHSEIILTSDTFSGPQGHAGQTDVTDFEIYLFDPRGKPIGNQGVARRITAPAMNTTVLRVGDLIGDARSFMGGAKVRLRPHARSPMHASDLFSSAFVRWTTGASFDNVHANPDPLEWQRPEAFFYSMPFPALSEYECFYSVFNPYQQRSVGEITLHDARGGVLRKIGYDLPGQSSVFLDVATGELISDVETMFSGRAAAAAVPLTQEGGTIAVANVVGTVKNFGYLLIRKRGGRRFSIDHPIHQSMYPQMKALAPFDANGGFRARNVLYTPLLFNSRKIGGITLDTRYHLSAGRPLEDALWLSPFVNDGDGTVPWQFAGDKKLRSMLPATQIIGGAIRLGTAESCIIDCSKLGLSKDFSGGLSLPISPLANHTLMKVEVRVKEWGTHAFTHFRPGLGASRAYQRPVERGRLATDYITSGARLERKGGRLVRDEILCIINIDDKEVVGNPTVEIFSSAGLLARVKLGEVPPFACRHFVLSQQSTKHFGDSDLSLRLVDEHATLLMSVVHIDHELRDIALDHGSDRFSTFGEFKCIPAPL
jgi:hypothetical protein